MSRSYKKIPVLKVHGHLKNIYWKLVRKKINSAIKTGTEIIPNPKEIICDYDYTEYRSNCAHVHDCYCMRTHGRKKCQQK